MVTPFIPCRRKDKTAIPQKQAGSPSQSAFDKFSEKPVIRWLRAATPPIIEKSERRQFLIKAATVCGGLALGMRLNVFAAEKMDMQEHAHHHAMITDSDVKSSMADYKLPTLRLVRSDGTAAMFPNEIDDGRPVILNFIYTSCTTVCPLTSQVFSQVQKMLATDSEKVHMVSISIDPEYDTPVRLTAYAKKYNASTQWQHYTGTIEASVSMQKAFNAYRGDKMNHIPLTFLRAAPGEPWVRLEGFANPDQVVSEYRKLASNK